jgi:hypothetical protein
LARFALDWEEPLVVTGTSMLRSPSLSVFIGPAPRRFEIPPRELGFPVFDVAFLEPRPLGTVPLELGPMGAIVVVDCEM